MRILAVDPGTEQSGVVLFEDGKIQLAHCQTNDALLFEIKINHFQADLLAIELFASMGMAIGETSITTIRWTGRFQQAWHDPEAVRFVYRRDVKMYLCGTMRAKDANVRQALIDKLGPQGTKRLPGPTYGVKSHAWSALAVAVVAAAC